MKALISTELLKLTTTRAPWILSTSAVVFSAAAALLSVFRSGRHSLASLGTTGAELNVLAGFSRGAVVALVLGAAAATAEFRHSTIAGAVLRSPRRARLASAKAAVVALVATVVGLIGLLVVLGIGLAAGAVSPALFTVDVAVRCAGLLLAYPAYGLIGLGVGMVIPRRHAVAAILPAAWILFLEALLLSFISRHPSPWGLNGVSAAAANALDVTPILPVWAGATALAGYALAACAGATVCLIRSDLT
jgi:hypothetical protein